MTVATGDRNQKLLEAGLALSSELSLDAVLQRIVELAVEITGARYGALGVLGPGGEAISEFVTTGVTQEQRRAIGHPPVGRGLLGALIHDATPLRLAEISRDARSVGFPPNHPPMHSFLGAPVKAKGRVFGNIYLTEKQGADEFTHEDEEALLILAAQAGVAVENARLYAQSRQRERRLEALREIATSILERTDPDEVLELVAGRARELVGADLATIAVPEDEVSLIIRIADGTRAAALKGALFPREGSISGEVIASGRPLTLEDASNDPRVYQPIVRLGGVGPVLLVPLAAAGRTFGTLALANDAGGRPFDQADLELVETFASQAVVAIEYGRAQRELRRLAILDDRERIARELHDGVIQSLFAVGMGLQATASLIGDPDLAGRMEEGVSEIDRVIRDLRNYIFGLRPGILADRQLDQALRDLAEDFASKTGITTVVEVGSDVASELASQAANVIQLAREALSNVGRHSGATTCRVSLYRRDGASVLEIDDDGRGFDPQAAQGKGHGLRNLRDRAASLGGSLEIESAPEQGEGTTVRVTIPL